MNYPKINITLLFVSLFLSACIASDKRDENSSIINRSLQNESQNFEQASSDSITKVFRALYLIDGESLVIVRKTFGCFSYINETVTVTRTNNHYSVKFKNTEATHNNSELILKDFDSTFTKSLIDFGRYYQNVLRNYKKDSLSFSTTSNSLSIQRGFHTVDLSDISYEDLQGYTSLIYKIKGN